MSSFVRRQLGRTGLQVSPIGIGGGSGISSKDLLYAFEQGINYFFFSSDLHHNRYSHSSQALRTLCQHGSAVREQVVLATVTYINDPEKLPAILTDLLRELRIDYIDVFHWGWITEHTDMLPLVKAGLQLKREDSPYCSYRQIILDVNTTLQQKGLVRYVGASFHSRKLAYMWMRNVDVMMLRYNLAHLGAEEEIAPFLYGVKDRDPGVVVFNVAHEGGGYFHIPPIPLPLNTYVPSIPDCYRFALTQPWVDMVLMGPTNRSEIDQAMAAMEQGPMDADEYRHIREYGALWHKIYRRSA